MNQMTEKEKKFIEEIRQKVVKFQDENDTTFVYDYDENCPKLTDILTYFCKEHSH